MSDNTNICGENISTDEITDEESVAFGAKVERIKVGYGEDGTYSDVNESNGLPISIQADGPDGGSLANPLVFMEHRSDVSNKTRETITTTSQMILDARENRHTVLLENSSTNTIVYLSFADGDTTVANSSMSLYPLERYWMDTPMWSGEIHAITSSGTADLKITEFWSA